MEGIYYAISVIVPTLQTLVLAVMIPLLIQEEPLVGTTAFLVHPPIRRAFATQRKGSVLVGLIVLPLCGKSSC